MKIKDIKNYSFKILNSKIVNCYQKCIFLKKINIKKKNFLINSFYALMVIIDMRLCNIKSKEIQYNNLEEFFCIKNKKLEKNIINFLKDKTKQFLNNIFYFIYLSFPFSFKTVLGPGTLIKSFIQRITNFILYNIFKEKISKTKLINTYSNKSEFLNLCKQSKIKLPKNIIKLIPESYFSNEILNPFKNKVNLISSASILFNKDVSKIIAIKNIKLNNIIHGGGFYEYKNSYLESWEKHFSGEYPKLFLIRDIKTHIKSVKYKKYNLIFALRSPERAEDKFLNPHLYNSLQKKGGFKFTLPILKEFNIRFRVHPRGINTIYKKYIKNEYFKNPKKRINPNDILIFDNLSSSLTYWLVYLKIPFVYILNDIKFNYYTKPMRKFVKFAILNQVIFFPKNIHQLKNYFHKLKSGKISVNKILGVNKEILSIPYKKMYL
jgi:hypothetical protein